MSTRGKSTKTGKAEGLPKVPKVPKVSAGVEKKKPIKKAQHTALLKALAENPSLEDLNTLIKEMKKNDLEQVKKKESKNEGKK